MIDKKDIIIKHFQILPIFIAFLVIRQLRYFFFKKLKYYLK